MIGVPNGLQEELALERLAAEAFQRESDEAWQAKQYTWARLMKKSAEEARKRILELEEREAGA